jgi:hypothetical protein
MHPTILKFGFAVAAELHTTVALALLLDVKLQNKVTKVLIRAKKGVRGIRNGCSHNTAIHYGKGSLSAPLVHPSRVFPSNNHRHVPLCEADATQKAVTRENKHNNGFIGKQLRG